MTGKQVEQNYFRFLPSPFLSGECSGSEETETYGKNAGETGVFKPTDSLVSSLQVYSSPVASDAHPDAHGIRSDDLFPVSDSPREFMRDFIGRLYDSCQSWADRKRESNRRRQAAWKARNPDRVRAHSLANSAQRRGELYRTDCVMCGNPEAEGHHFDYTKPLHVTWLCKACHERLHTKRLASPSQPSARHGAGSGVGDE